MKYDIWEVYFRKEKDENTNIGQCGNYDSTHKRKKKRTRKLLRRR